MVLVLVTSAGFAQELERKRPGKKDDPRARQKFLEEMRGGDGVVPPGARLRALEQMDEMIREEGERFWRFQSSLTKTQNSTSGSSAGQDPSITNGSPSPSQWLFIGPRPTNGFIVSSGRTSAMVVDPRDLTGNTVYVGGAQGGVWKSVDGGTNWTPLMDGPNIPSLAVGSMAIDATEPVFPCTSSAVYVGTGEQGSAFDSYYGAGVLKSCDGGITWTQLGAASFAGPLTGCGSNGFSCGGAFIGGLSVRPGGANPATILAAVTLPNGVLGGPGVYRSTDGGASWGNVRPGGGHNNDLGATAVQYATNLIAYAGLDALGMYKSTDGGATWTLANGSGANTLTPGGRIEFSVALSDPNTVYASVGQSGAGAGLAGFYKTVDGGLNWTRLGPVSSPGLTDYCTPQCWYDNVVAVNPTNPNVVFVGGSAVTRHVSKTVDGGSNWAAATANIHVDHHAAAFTPDGTRLYWGNDGGVYRTDDTGTSPPGATWTNLNTNLGLTQFYSSFALHPTDINVTFGGTQDNGTQRYDGTQDISLAWTNTGACGDGAGNVIDQSNPSIVYANCQEIDIVKSTNGGLSGFNPADSGISSADKDRTLFIPPLVGDNYSSAPNHLYFGTYRVWQTRDQGASWYLISNDLTSSSLHDITRLAVAPSDRTVLYVTTGNGRVWKGTGLLGVAPNDCVTLLNCFTEITSGLLPSARRINAVVVSPSDPHTVYVGHGGFDSSTTRRLSRKVGDGAWVDITGNLPNTPIQDIVADPDIAGRLYVATDVGVFMSTDDGATWATLANGLPRVAVYGLKLHRPSRTLRAATHGRGLWDLAVPATISGAGGILTPSSLTFVSRPLYTTSSEQSFSFTNHGNAATTVGTVSVSGDYAITTHNCVGSLGPSASCNIGVTFTPNSSGIHNNKLTITTSAANSPVVGGLSGLGAPPNDNFADAVIVTLGAFTHRVNTLGATVEGADPTGSCDTSEPPHARNVWYNYTPGTSGQAIIHTRTSNYDTVLSVFTGTQGSFAEVLNGCHDDIGNIPESPSEVTINVTAGVTYRIMASGFVPSDGGELVLNVTGPAPLASLSVSKTSLTFANQAVGSTSLAQSFTLTAVTAAVNGIVINASGDFAPTTDCPATLAHNATCTVNVTFTPTAGGARNGSISITSSGAGSPQAVALTGVGDTISLSPAVVNISAVVGNAATQAVMFFNGSGGPVTVTNVGVTGDYAQSHNCTTVASAGSCTVTLTFAPIASGARNGVLTLTTSGGVRTATLNGTGVEFTLGLLRPIRPARGSGSGIVLAPGETAVVELALTMSGGVGERADIQCLGLPPGIRCDLVAPKYVDGGTHAITVTLSGARSARSTRLRAGATAGNYVVVVRAQVAGGQQTVAIPLTVVGPAAKEPVRPQRLRR